MSRQSLKLMEKHRATGRRKHEEQEEAIEDHKSRHGRKHHQQSKVPESRRQRVPLIVQGQKRTLEKALSGDNDYVRQWLAQIESNANPDPLRAARYAPSNDDQDRALHAGIAASRHAGYVLQDLLGPERGKRRHNSSSDSSLLEIPVRTRTGQAKKDNPRPAMPEPQKDKPTSRKKQKVDSSNSEVSSQTTSPTAAKETFEKRPRRKTREDRYEPKRKETHPKKTDEEMATNRKRLKRCDRGKAAKKAGEELMQNFSSKSIGRERLTIRPLHGPGLFINGRASSPARHRGLPDLAFSEMAFLQHSLKKGPAEIDNKVTSNSREKSRRNIARAQDEISTFFKPKRRPLREVPSNQAGPSPPDLKKDDFIYSKQLELERSAMKHVRSASFDSPYERTGSHGRAASFPDENYAPRNCSPAFGHSTNPPKSASRLSGKATTYVSWSESEYSPGHKLRQISLDREAASPTPESVRRSITNTGIFKDTGIQLIPDPSYTTADVPSGTHEYQRRKDQTRVPRSPGAPTGIAASTITNPSETEVYRSDIGFDNRNSPTRTGQRSRDVHQDQTGEQQTVPDCEEVSGSSQSRVVEYFDPRLGWLEAPQSIDRSQQTSAVASKEILQESKSAPVSRNEIAKHARVKLPKRPSTTLPIVDETAGQIERLVGLGIRSGSAFNFASDVDAPFDHQQTGGSIGTAISDSLHAIPNRSDPRAPMLPGAGEEQWTRHAANLRQPKRYPDDDTTSGSNIAPLNNPHQLTGSYDTRSEARFRPMDSTNFGMAHENENSAARNVHRRSLITDIHATSSFRNTRLSPILEAESLYANQLERQAHSTGYHPRHGSDFQVSEGFDGPCAMMCPETDSYGYQNQHTVQPRGHNIFDYDPAIYHFHKDGEYVDADYAGDWDAQPCGFHEGDGLPYVHDFGPYDDNQEEKMYEDQELNEDQELYEDEELYDCQERLHQDGGYGGYELQLNTPTAGFWKPHLQY